MKEYLYNHLKKPIKIVGISSSKRRDNECAREDPISTELLKLCLNEAKKQGAKIEIIELSDLKIGACKECYSTCPAQCRFSETNYTCDCFTRTSDVLFNKKGEDFTIEKAYDVMTKKEFFDAYNSKWDFSPRDDMRIVYKKLLEADGIIFATYSSFYSRPALLQNMLSRLCALDGGVEELWGDGKNLQASYNYTKEKGVYKQRLYGKHFGIINVSKEGDSVSPNLLKACTMMGMKNVPLGIGYGLSWYDDETHKTDKNKILTSQYTLRLTKDLGKNIVKEIKTSSRKYGKEVDLV
ncbi:MAG: NAD(P)H-dependent oxidoreductase [Candidatus ainarchaeum sp.]|nr:NAD(P)H-dependent oxidoreductase [Candidatus ainarchaeum sp.]